MQDDTVREVTNLYGANCIGEIVPVSNPADALACIVKISEDKWLNFPTDDLAIYTVH